MEWTRTSNTAFCNPGDWLLWGNKTHLRVCSARSVRIQGELFGFDDCWACTCCGGTRSLSAADSEDPFSKTKSLAPDSDTCIHTWKRLYYTASHFTHHAKMKLLGFLSLRKLGVLFIWFSWSGSFNNIQLMLNSVYKTKAVRPLINYYSPDQFYNLLNLDSERL